MMKQIFLSIGVIILALTPYGSVSAQNTGKLYRQMSPSEQALFVQEQAAQIGRQISGHEYEFTPAFEMEVQKHDQKHAGEKA